MLNLEENQLLIPPQSDRSNSCSSSNNDSPSTPSSYDSSTAHVYDDQFPVYAPTVRNSVSNYNASSKILRTSSARNNRDSENTNSGTHLLYYLSYINKDNQLFKSCLNDQDYLEPVSHNVRQNFEYFTPRSSTLQVPHLILGQTTTQGSSSGGATDSKSSLLKPNKNYYNDNVTTYIEDPHPVK